MQTTYDVNDAVSRIDTKTEKLANLDVAVTYNHALWLQHFMAHLWTLESLNAIGDVMGLTRTEYMKYTDNELLATMENEIGNLSPNCYIENGMATRIIT